MAPWGETDDAKPKRDNGLVTNKRKLTDFRKRLTYMAKKVSRNHEKDSNCSILRDRYLLRYILIVVRICSHNFIVGFILLSRNSVESFGKGGNRFLKNLLKYKKQVIRGERITPGSGNVIHARSKGLLETMNAEDSEDSDCQDGGNSQIERDGRYVDCDRPVSSGSSTEVR